jgi:hypothetical protein
MYVYDGCLGLGVVRLESSKLLEQMTQMRLFKFESCP